MTLIAELQRRNVIRMAGLYLVGAWLLTQVASTVLPLFGTPAWVPRTIVIMLAIGLLPALAFAWVFELTPDGLKRDAEVPPAESIAPRTGRRMDRLIIAVLALSLGYFALDKFLLAPRREAALVAHAEQSARQAATLAAPAAQAERSIAVLPFVNLSSDEEQTYFSDGLSEDLITALSQFSGLKVISRNSSFRFRGSQDDARVIGAKLGVSHLLAGSVRRAGDVVRISADLVSASDGRTLWSQRFDRPYTDLFKLQDEITQAVATALKAKLLPDGEATSQSDRPPSGNLDAYTAYLQGNFQAARSDHAGFQKSIHYFEQAVRLDPRYAQAHAQAAQSLMLDAAIFLSGAQFRAAAERAEAHTSAALAIDPRLALAHIARGLLLMNRDLDWRGAEREFLTARQLAPNDNQGPYVLGQAVAALGRGDEAIALLRRAAELDPLDVGRSYWLSILEAGRGNLAEAERLIDKTIELRPEAVQSSAQKVAVQVLRGQRAQALATAKAMPPGLWTDIAMAYAAQGGADPAVGNAALASLIRKQSEGAAYQIAQVQALRGDDAAVFAWLERAWVNRDTGLRRTLLDPFFVRYRKDARFVAFCRKVGLVAG